MLKRALEMKLHELTGYYSAVIVTGPKQSGKTTLCLMAYPKKPYVSLEAIDMRAIRKQRFHISPNKKEADNSV
jgi:uncharacterized protein